MIVGHELAHVKRGHLRWLWVILPSYLVPFLGMALSRAREYTCDRYGKALAGNTDGALLGLTILAAGGTHGRRVNREALVAQRAALNTGFMRLAEWLSTHPPLACRLAELDPALSTVPDDRRQGTRRAVFMVGAVVLPFVVMGMSAVVLLPMVTRLAQSQPAAAPSPEDEDKYEQPPAEIAHAQVTQDFDRIIAFSRAKRQQVVRSLRMLAICTSAGGRCADTNSFHLDPFDGNRYGYQSADTFYILWSSGPDGESDTTDDLYFDSRVNRRSVGLRPEVESKTGGQPPASSTGRGDVGRGGQQ